MKNAAIIGATGYTGEELVNILLRHKDVKLSYLAAKIDKPTKISTLFPHFKGKIDLICQNAVDVDEASEKADLVFLSLPHKISMEYAPTFLKKNVKVIDLSADYRLPEDIYKIWYDTEHKDKDNIKIAVYGLPELYRKDIKKARLIANPGCYPTSAILACAPLIKNRLVDLNNIIVDSKSGVTGAGRRPDVGLSFGEVDENLKAYKVNQHQHAPEINQELSKLAKGTIVVTFVPHLVPIQRGILSTIYFLLKKSSCTKGIIDLYKKFYKDEPFVRIFEEGSFPQIKDVLKTNYCDIGVKVDKKRAIIVSCIDNLMKGAAGQAVQNMNIMFGFSEEEALV